MPIFKLVLHRAYYDQGFFNVTVDFDRYVSDQEGPLELVLEGTERQTVVGRIDRHSNRNGTARIFGGIPLKKWFQENFSIKDSINIDLSSKSLITMKKG